MKQMLKWILKHYKELGTGVVAGVLGSVGVWWVFVYNNNTDGVLSIAFGPISYKTEISRELQDSKELPKSPEVYGQEQVDQLQPEASEGIQVGRAISRGLRAYNSGDYATALAEFRSLAELKNAEAQYYLGNMYYYGDGVREIQHAAFIWYSRSADQKFAPAQTRLGLMYANGESEAKTHRKPWRVSCLLKDVGYLDKKDTIWDFARALRRYIYATYHLIVGDEFERDYLEVAEDYREAAELWCEASRQGNADAQFNLGVAYENGEGVPKGHATALYWYEKAAKQGLAEAQFNLGRAYYYGRGVEDKGVEEEEYEATAAKWYHQAALQGHADAQAYLGVAYGKGKGVVQDYKKAYIWLDIASANGEEQARRNRDIVREKLSPHHIDVLVKAQALAKQCLASGYKVCPAFSDENKIEQASNGDGEVTESNGKDENPPPAGANSPKNRE